MIKQTLVMSVSNYYFKGFCGDNLNLDLVRASNDFSEYDEDGKEIGYYLVKALGKDASELV